MRAPVVVFLHGSSGLGLKAIGEWQLWLADLGIEAKPLGLFLDKWMLRYRKHGRFGAANERAKARKGSAQEIT